MALGDLPEDQWAQVSTDANKKLRDTFLAVPRRHFACCKLAALQSAMQLRSFPTFCQWLGQPLRYSEWRVETREVNFSIFGVADVGLCVGHRMPPRFLDFQVLAVEEHPPLVTWRRQFLATSLAGLSRGLMWFLVMSASFLS